MPRPLLIEDRSIIVEGLEVIGADNDESERIGAIRVDGMTVSYCVSEGYGLHSMQAVDLLVAIEAISSRFPGPWTLPTSIYLWSTEDGYQADVTTNDCDMATRSVFAAANQIASVASFVLDDNYDRVIHILVGDDALHREYHADADHRGFNCGRSKARGCWRSVRLVSR